MRQSAMMRGAQLLAAVLAAAVAACGDGRPARVASPDGRHTLVVTVNHSKADRTKYLCLFVQIVDAEGRVRHEEQTGASVRMAWRAHWSGPGRLVLDSSDIGTMAWRARDDGTWERDPSAPAWRTK
jgi:hypothetical protein